MASVLHFSERDFALYGEDDFWFASAFTGALKLNTSAAGAASGAVTAPTSLSLSAAASGSASGSLAAATLLALDAATATATGALLVTANAGALLLDPSSGVGSATGQITVPVALPLDGAAATSGASGQLAAAARLTLSAAGVGTSGGQITGTVPLTLTASAAASGGDMPLVVTAAFILSAVATATLSIELGVPRALVLAASAASSGALMTTARVYLEFGTVDPFEAYAIVDHPGGATLPAVVNPGTETDFTFGIDTGRQRIVILIPSLMVSTTYTSDLTFTLISPAGVPAILASGVGGAGTDFGVDVEPFTSIFGSGVVVFYEGYTPIASGTPPYATSTSSGLYAPQGSLSQFYSGDQSGTWTLRVGVRAGGSAATVRYLALLASYRARTAATIAAASASIEIDVPIDPQYDTPVTPGGGGTGGIGGGGSNTIIPIQPGPPPPLPGPGGSVSSVLSYPYPGYSYLTGEVTTLWKPGTAGYTGGDVVHQFDDWVSARVDIALNDQRTAEFTFDIGTPGSEWALTPWKFALRVWLTTPFSTRCVLWGPIIAPDVDVDEGKITMSASGPEIRLIHHFVRRYDAVQALGGGRDEFGNEAYPGSSGQQPRTPIDHRGLRILRDAADNTNAQNARHVPVLGIVNGDNNVEEIKLGPEDKTDSRRFMNFQRGDPVFESMKQIIAGWRGPDMEIQPTVNVPGAYARMNTFKRQGNSPYIPPTVAFHDGWGADNAKVQYKPGSRLITHVHIIANNGGRRASAANAASSAENGVYVEWREEEMKFFTDEGLQGRADRIIQQFGYPRDSFTVTPRDTCDLYYRDDFKIGDTIAVGVEKDSLSRSTTGRIHKVSLIQEAGKPATTQLEVVDDPKIGDVLVSGDDA